MTLLTSLSRTSSASTMGVVCSSTSRSSQLRADGDSLSSSSSSPLAQTQPNLELRKTIYQPDRLKAKEVRGIEMRFIELLTSAPGTKEDKQDFFRGQLKLTIARPNYDTMWYRLVESLGRVGAAEAVLDYVISSADDRLKELLLNARDDEEVDLRAREPSIIRQIFYGSVNDSTTISKPIDDDGSCLALGPLTK